MKTSKSFDCVQMKNAIQEKLQARRAGMSEAQREDDMTRQLDSSDSPTARLWRKISPVATQPLLSRAPSD